MRRWTALWLALMLCMFSAAAGAPAQPALCGKEAVLYCAENGQVLLDKDMDKPAHPASITKLMTALLVLESGLDLSQVVTVSHDAVYAIDRDSTHIALDEGEQVTLEQMLYAMLLTSANDAANVLTEAVDGSQAAFAAHMTARAAELGCRHTHFVNAHGLDDSLHYTTAYDMARITAELVKHDRFLTVSSTQVYHMPATNKQSEPRSFWNKQNMLNPQSKFYDKTAIAGKNGYTTQAGHTLVTVARRDGVTLIAVTLGSTASRFDKHRDTAALFSYGFDQFHKETLSTQDIAAVAKQAGLAPDEGAIAPVIVLLPAGQTAQNLVFSPQGEGLAATSGAGDVLTLEVPQQEPELPAAVLEGAAEPETAPPAADMHMSPALMYAGFGLAGALAVLSVLAAYRTVRIRRQRRRIRALRQHHRARD